MDIRDLISELRRRGNSEEKFEAIASFFEASFGDEKNPTPPVAASDGGGGEAG